MRQSALRIRTPEGIVFALPLAGPVPRFLAWTIDLACIALGGSLLGGVLSVLGFLSADLAAAFFTLAYFVLSVGYGIATEWLWRGQTVGKRVLGLRVVDEQGARLQPNQVVLRNLLRPVDSLPAFYLVGGAAMLLSRHGQRLGDYASNTVVVRATRPALPAVDRVLAIKYNSLREHPHLAARLRQRLTPEEATLGLRALLRRESLDPAARIELFRRLADHYRAVVAFPDSAVEALADEQYVRNLVDLVFRPDRREAGQRLVAATVAS